ncbi:hypothetical protein ACFQ7N_40410 [Streptomyces niveus]|uniref:hypothetical protein n=1 Tax=Streptomyces niveus TaxID=193462 RepID=UPI0036B2C6A0
MTGLIKMPHTGLEVPHTRYMLAQFQQMATATCGIAYSATLIEEERCVGVLENKGNGGGTQFYPATAEDHQAVHTFAGACRLDGETPPDEEVFECLIVEYDLAQEVAKFGSGRTALLRAIDEDGWIGITIGIDAAPARLAQADCPFLPRLARDLKASDPYVTAWEFWTGDQWQPLNLPVIPD